MDLAKHLEFFDPQRNDIPIHIIGLGAVGSHVALMLTRLGVSNFYLYEFDTVVPYNVANQSYYFEDITHPKLDSMIGQMRAINPQLNIKLFPKGYIHQNLSGYVFLCADSIELRKQIVTDNRFNTNIKAMLDFRMRLSDAQHYMADWDNDKEKEDFFNSMQFTAEEAKAATPVSACGTTLSIIPTVWILVAEGIANWINFDKGLPHKKVILLDSFRHEVLAM